MEVRKQVSTKSQNGDKGHIHIICMYLACSQSVCIYCGLCVTAGRMLLNSDYEGWVTHESYHTFFVLGKKPCGEHIKSVLLEMIITNVGLLIKRYTGLLYITYIPPVSPPARGIFLTNIYQIINT